MAIDYVSAMAFCRNGLRKTYTVEDTSFYALSIGMAANPLDQSELNHVLETRGPRVVPTMAAVLAKSISRDLGLDMLGVLHAEQRLTVHRVLPPAAELVIDTQVTSIIDKGPDRGAIVSFDSVAVPRGEDAPLFTIGTTVFARRDGGCGGSSGPPPARHIMPDRAPDVVHIIATRPDQALLYRLMATSIRCMPIQRSHNDRAFPVRSCTGCALMRSPAARSWRPSAIRTATASRHSTCGSPRRSIPAKVSRPKSGSMARRYPSAVSCRNVISSQSMAAGAR